MAFFFYDHLNLCEAFRSKDLNKWGAGIEEEYNSPLYMGNGIWKLTNFPKDCKNVGCKWMFHTKNDALGEIIRDMAKLVVKGYS